MKRKRSLFGTLQLDLPPALHLGGLFALGAVDRSKGSQGQRLFGRLVQPGLLSFAISGRGASRSLFGAPRSRWLSIFASIPMVGLGLFYYFLYRPDSDVRALIHAWPMSLTCAQQFYRARGAVFGYLYLYKDGYDSYYNLQTGILDGVILYCLAAVAKNEFVATKFSFLVCVSKIAPKVTCALHG
jgi:hypothetical protein